LSASRCERQITNNNQVANLTSRLQTSCVCVVKTPSC